MGQRRLLRTEITEIGGWVTHIERSEFLESSTVLFLEHERVWCAVLQWASGPRAATPVTDQYPLSAARA
jgi:hypothetical protein